LDVHEILRPNSNSHYSYPRGALCKKKASGFSAEERLRLCQAQLTPVLAELGAKLLV
jgi:hypothetical protein